MKEDTLYKAVFGVSDVGGPEWVNSTYPLYIMPIICSLITVFFFFFPTGKKGQFITDSSQGPLPHPMQWCRSESHLLLLIAKHDK